jgi:DNA-binding MarR family transcriptional regulator
MSNSDPQIQRLVEIVLFKYRHLMTHILKQTLKEISTTQFILLEFLSKSAELNMGQIAKHMGHRTPATTGLIDRLLAIGMVERTTIPEDRRQILIKITPKGLALVNLAKQEIVDSMHELGEQLSPEDRQAWFRINETIYKRLNS